MMRRLSGVQIGAMSSVGPLVSRDSTPRSIDLPRERQRFVEWNRTAGDSRRQVFSLDELHHQRERPVCVLDPVDVRDVRVIQRGKQFRFALES